MKYLNGQRELFFSYQTAHHHRKKSQETKKLALAQPKENLPTMRSTGTGESVDKRQKKGEEENIFLSNLIM